MSKSILYLLIIGFFSCTISKVELKSISVLDLQNKLKNENSIMVIDVRTESEFDGPLGHIANSKLKPLSNISQTIIDLKTIGDKPVYVVCRSGNRSTTATMKLRTKGINAINVEGGMKAWNKIIK